ncbi:hypothetical protein ACWEPM_29045 [Streptomyces sp. NPDC004244]
MATPHQPAGHGPVPGNPYSTPGGYTPAPAPAPAPAPGSYAQAPAPAPAPGGYVGPLPMGHVPPECRACGGRAAANHKVRAHVGVLVLMRFEHLDGPFCRACGIAVVRQMTTRALCLGWWGPLSLVLFNPFTLVWNLFVYLKYSKLPPSTPAPGRTHLDTGPQVLRRPLAYVALIPLAWALWVISQIIVHSA